ncbi:MAG: hypothetical protein R3D98_00480 [Candidatus Krumholzibacteriia bacterium]
MVDTFMSWLCRILFGLALVALAAGVAEKVANLAGYTLAGVYEPERLLEISVSLAVLVVALLLRQIRDAVRRPAGG